MPEVFLGWNTRVLSVQKSHILHTKGLPEASQDACLHIFLWHCSVNRSLRFANTQHFHNWATSFLFQVNVIHPRLSSVNCLKSNQEWTLPHPPSSYPLKIKYRHLTTMKLLHVRLSLASLHWGIMCTFDPMPGVWPQLASQGHGLSAQILCQCEYSLLFSFGLSHDFRKQTFHF